MRRHEREIKDQESIEAIIKEAIVCRLAMIDGEWPYIVPMNFGYQDNTLYFHCARKGSKAGLLENNPKVGFEIDQPIEIIEGEKACRWTQKYRSVIGTGEASFIEDMDEKRTAMDIIMAQYSDGQWDYPDKMLGVMGFVKVEIREMRAKANAS